MENNRGSWGSNVGFVLAAIGSAIGMGNLWGFPYKMGANGGLPFLLIYLAFVVLCGVVVMGVEMTIGRRTGKSPVLALGEFGKKYKIVGWFGVLSAIIIMGFYSVLIGYSVRYMLGFGAQILGVDGFGGLVGSDFFMAYTQDPTMVLIFTAVTFLISYLLVAGGVEGGIEKFNKIGIPALFILLIGIIIYNLTLPGSEQGVAFMFSTKGMEMAGTEFNFLNACRTAAGQMLFSCSLGMGAMITYGSYLKKDANISKNAWIIPAADTLAAILAGLAIFPAVFAQGGTPNGGVGLLFMTMHSTFSTMGFAGNIVGFIFYLCVVFAGVSSAISLMEVASSHIIDSNAQKGKKVSRRKAVGIITVIMLVLSVPVCFDMCGIANWPFYQFLAAGSKDLIDFYDFFTEGIMMPLGAMLMCVIIGWKSGFKWMSDEVEQGGAKFYAKKFFQICVKYVTPVLMLFVLISLALSYVGL